VLYTFVSLEIAHEDFAASEFVTSLQEVYLKATKQHGKESV